MIHEDLAEFLKTTPEVQAMVSSGLIASDSGMPTGYIFIDKPYKKVETLSNSAILVVRHYEDWETSAPGSAFEFPKIDLDIWASPKRDVSMNPEDYNADDVIRSVYTAIRKYIHTKNSKTAIKVWNGTPIALSEVLDGPTYRNVADGNGARVARISIGVTI